METIITIAREMFSIGTVSFGGGWSVVGVIKEQLIQLGWMDDYGFARILALAQVTPGPVALNTSTLVGYQQGGILGAAISTIALVTPGILIIIIGRWILQRNIVNQKTLTTALGIASVSLLGFTLWRLTSGPLVSWWFIAIAAITVLLNIKTRMHSLLVVAIGVGAGMLFASIGSQ